jgi:hypothetical protein
METSRKYAMAMGKVAEISLQKGVSLFHRIRNEILAMGVAFFTLRGMKDFGLGILELDRNALYMARSVGLSVEELTRWQGAARKMGSSTDDINGAFLSITKMVGEIHNLGRTAAMTGDSPLLRAGVNPNRFAAQTTSQSERMLMLARAFSKLNFEQALTWGQMAGFSLETIVMLRQGEPAIRNMMKTIPATSEGAARSALALQNRLEDLQNRFRMLGRTMLDHLGPPLLHITESFEKLLERVLTPARVTAITTALEDFGTWLDNVNWEDVEKLFTKISDMATNVADALGGIKTVFQAIAAAILGFMIGGPVGAAVGLGTHLGLKGFESMLRQFKETDKFKEMASRPGYKGSGLDWMMSNLGGEGLIAPKTTAIESNVHIANLHIHTSATDSAGIAKDLRRALDNEMADSLQAMKGLN